MLKVSKWKKEEMKRVCKYFIFIYLYVAVEGHLNLLLLQKGCERKTPFGIFLLWVPLERESQPVYMDL